MKPAGADRVRELNEDMAGNIGDSGRGIICPPRWGHDKSLESQPKFNRLWPPYAFPQFKCWGSRPRQRGVVVPVHERGPDADAERTAGASDSGCREDANPTRRCRSQLVSEP
jgi:hypothetical protein